MKKDTIKILFVCMGNICRSPAGEGVLKSLVLKDSLSHIHVESCGIGNWHVGNNADLRMQEAAKLRGILLTSRAQQFQTKWLDTFNYILAADQEVLKYLYQYAESAEQKAKISLMTHFSSIYYGQEVPDPYYQTGGAFELVLDMLEDSCKGLLQHIRDQK